MLSLFPNRGSSSRITTHYANRFPHSHPSETMRAVVFTGEGVKIDDVPEPTIQEGGDALVLVRKTAICASDLHVVSGKTPGMREGGVIGHEFVGQITQLGKDVSRH